MKRAFYQTIEDFKVNEITSGNIIVVVLRVLLTQKAWAIFLIRLVVNKVPLLDCVARVLLGLLFHIEIGRNVQIGNRLFIPHPTDIVIARNSVIGDSCSLYHRITFAEKRGIHTGPQIGSRCIVGTGSVIVGNISIGDNVSIGPNSVIINDVGANLVVFGNPEIGRASCRERV